MKWPGDPFTYTFQIAGIHDDNVYFRQPNSNTCWKDCAFMSIDSFKNMAIERLSHG